MDSSHTEPADEYSDHSRGDTNFSVPSNRSVKRRKISPCICKGQDENEGSSSDEVDRIVPELDDQYKKSYGTVKKTIEAGQVARLRIDECKVYLRNHGLRLSGSKEALVRRIKEHIDIINVGGEKLYPASSFVLNCRGDACVGDIVMFKQEVYEGFDVASRSSSGPQGTRAVAGRIVKESYGAAKQQHTFTIEVLWTKGKKPLPPLHPLLIKGRNLYKMKTIRQEWEDEGKRLKILSEKHARGDVARSYREARIKERELRNIHKRSRSTRGEHTDTKQEQRRDPLKPASMKPERVIKQQPEQQHRHPANTLAEQSYMQNLHPCPTTCEASIPSHRRNLPGNPNSIPNAHMPDEGVCHKQLLISMNCGFHEGQYKSFHPSYYNSSKNPTPGGYLGERHMNYETRSCRYISSSNYHTNPCPLKTPKENSSYSRGSPSRGSGIASCSQQRHASTGQKLNAAHNHPPIDEKKQVCRYYMQGWCAYGDRCKYLHE